MKIMGKVLIKLTMVMVLILGMLGRGERAEAIEYIFDPDLQNQILYPEMYVYTGNLTLNSILTMPTDSQLDVTGYDVTNAGTLIMQSSSQLTANKVINNNSMTVTNAFVSGDFTSTSNGTLSLLGAMCVKGSFVAAELEHFIIGRVAPRPPPPPPGYEIFLSSEFFDALSNENILYGGSGIFSTGTIEITSLDLYFDPNYIYSDGDQFLLAVSGVPGGVSPNVTLTSNLDPAQFHLSYIDPTISFNDKVYEYAYVKVTAVPEPETLLLLCSGIGGLAVIRRKRGRNSGNS